MRAIERITGASLNTVSKLLIDAGKACATYHDEHVRGVKATRIQCDEIWAFCYSKQKNVATAKAAPHGAGDVWTWTALEATSKLLVSYMVGGRDGEYAMALMDVPVFCDAPFEAAPGRPLWYDNNLFLNYHNSFDRYFQVVPEDRLARMQADFRALCEAHDGGYLVMYTHPCRLFTTQFTDTFRHGANPPLRDPEGPRVDHAVGPLEPKLL